MKVPMFLQIACVCFAFVSLVESVPISDAPVSAHIHTTSLKTAEKANNIRFVRFKLTETMLWIKTIPMEFIPSLQTNDHPRLVSIDSTHPSDSHQHTSPNLFRVTNSIKSLVFSKRSLEVSNDESSQDGTGRNIFRRIYRVGGYLRDGKGPLIQNLALAGKRGGHHGPNEGHHVKGGHHHWH